MCGIAGSLCLEGGQAVSLELLEAMSAELTERGPDGDGLWISEDRRIGLCHRRLAILDLSDRAGQPMADASGEIHIVFNGEIYNFQEIKKVLLRSSANYKWNTDHSDTEVLLHAYEEWGISCVEKFRGMFACAIWDQRKRRLWLVRDRVGIKPLYYSAAGRRLNFASNLRALLRDPGQKREVNEKALYDFISLLAVPAPNTLMKGIYKLRAGTYLEIDETGRIEEHTYWDPLDQKKRRTTAMDEVDRLISELQESVDYRKVSDVPMGLFLSGGVDSSANLALFSQRGKIKNIKTFTVGYKNCRIYKNENSYARKVAGQFHAEHHDRILAEKEVMEMMPLFAKMMDDPVADPVIISQYYIAKMAREEGIKVVQVGEGADELFAGYTDWNSYILRGKANEVLPGWIKKLWFGLGAREDGDVRLREMADRDLRGEPIYWGDTAIITEADKKQLFSKAFIKRLKGHCTWDNFEEYYRRYREKAGKRDILGWMSYISLKFRLPDLLLARSDKACMACGVEARVPFLDHKFIEYVFSLPEHVKWNCGKPKYLLKRALRGILPDEVLDRKKEGFGLPVAAWFRSGLGREIEQTIQLFVDQSDFFDKKSIRRLLRNRQDYPPFLVWSFFVAALWWKNYIYDFPEKADGGV